MSFLHGVFDRDANCTWKMIIEHVLGKLPCQGPLPGSEARPAAAWRQDFVSFLEWFTLWLWTRFPARHHSQSSPGLRDYADNGMVNLKLSLKGIGWLVFKRYTKAFRISSFAFYGISSSWAHLSMCWCVGGTWQSWVPGDSFSKEHEWEGSIWIIP